jgi:hypothetical protein
LDSTNSNGSLLGGYQLVTCRLEELRPHPSYVRNCLAVPSSQLSALVERGDRAFLEPLMITQDRTILDGYARFELARLQGRAALPCIAYELTESEALHWLLQKHRRSNGLNDFTRILLALELEPWFKEKARSNQQAGGRQKGSSKLTEAVRLDVRSEIAAAAGVSVGNVTKVKQLTTTAHSDLLQALRNREISIHRAWGWSKTAPERQREELRLYQSEKGVKKTIRLMVSRHRSKSPPAAPDPCNLARQLLAPEPRPGVNSRAVQGAREVPTRRATVRSNSTCKAEIQLTAETRDAVLGKLRHAVAFQIGLWDTASEIAEMVDADLDSVLEWINSTSIVADSGLELGSNDLEDFLGGRKEPCKVGKKLPEYAVQ